MYDLNSSSKKKNIFITLLRFTTAFYLRRSLSSSHLSHWFPRFRKTSRRSQPRQPRSLNLGLTVASFCPVLLPQFSRIPGGTSGTFFLKLFFFQVSADFFICFDSFDVSKGMATQIIIPRKTFFVIRILTKLQKRNGWFLSINWVKILIWELGVLMTTIYQHNAPFKSQNHCKT